MGKSEDLGSLDQDAFTSPLSDDSENSFGDAESPTVTKTKGPRLIVIAADPSLWRDLRVMHNGLSFYKRRADDYGQIVDHKDIGQDLSIPILRRDTMRCMVGRVYRPCWEV